MSSLAVRELAVQPSEDEIKNLISKSQDIKKKAYAPYSHFKVGAALLTDNGTVFTGGLIASAVLSWLGCNAMYIVCFPFAQFHVENFSHLYMLLSGMHF